MDNFKALEKDSIEKLDGVDSEVIALKFPEGTELHALSLPCLSIWALTTINTAYGFTIASVGLFVAPLEVHRLWPNEESFALSAIVVAVAAAQLIGPPVGYFSDHYQSSLGRRRPLLIFSSVITSLLTLIIWICSSYRWRHSFFVSFFFLQVFITIIVTCQQGLISDLVPDRQRGFAGAAAAVNFLLGAISAFACMKVFSAWDYHVMYAIIVVFFLSSSFIACCNGSEVPSVGHNSIALSGLLSSYSFDFQRYQNFSALLGTKTIYYATAVIKSFLLFFVRDTFTITDAASSEALVSELSIAAEVAAALAALVAVFFLRGGGEGSDATRTSVVMKSSIRLLRISAIWMGILWLGPALVAHLVHKLFVANPRAAHGAGPWTGGMLCGTTMFGIGQGLYLASDQALQYILLPDREEASRHLGLASICTFVGTSAGGLTAGMLLSMFGGGAASGYSSAGYIAVFVFASIGCLGLVGVTLCIRSKQ